MKKKINKPMRAAGILLVATMLSTCLTAGTFAKYTTTDSATDTARVAKFGVVIDVNGYLYGKEYAVGGTNTPITYSGTTTNTGTVQLYTASGTAPAAANSEDVLAPGTQNDSGLGYAIHGTPEVDTQVTINIKAKNIYLKKNKYAVMETLSISNNDELNSAISMYGAANIYTYAADAWTLLSGNTYTAGTTYCRMKDAATEADFNSGDYYFPVVYSITGGTGAGSSSYSGGTQTADSLKAILTGISASTSVASSTLTADVTGYTTLSLTSQKMEANHSFETYSPSETLKWKWDFENSTAAVAEKYNKLDTILGDLVAQNDRTGDTANANPFKPASAITTAGSARVVTWDSTNNKYILPTVAATDGDGAITASNDYNLDTSVKLDVTVTQVD